MSLTLGTGPFAANRAGVLAAGEVPTKVAWLEPWPRRVRAVRGGRTVLDSRRGMALHRSGQLMSLWFPQDDIDRDAVPGDALTAPPTGNDPVAQALSGYLEMDYGVPDRWFEDGDAIYAHPRDPYHRVDVRSSDRHVVVRHGDLVVAETRRPKLLYETSLPVRYYLPWSDVRTDLLTLSGTVSECPYKGSGQHWNLGLPGGDAGDTVKDVAWSLPAALPEAFAASDHVCFYSSKVTVEVDGERVRS